MAAATVVAPVAAAPSNVYQHMTALAASLGAVNLGQGFPDEGTPDVLLEAARQAVGRADQYTDSAGLPALRAAIASACGPAADPDTEVTVTAGCTEALAATLLAVLRPGDEVLAFEPYYDAYPRLAAAAGARLVGVPLGPDPASRPDPERLRRAATPATRAVIVNTPHNPTGTVFTPTELRAVAEVAAARNLVVVADEVYEHFAYARPHHSLRALDVPGAQVVVCSGPSKSLSITGWRIGWAVAEPGLTARVRDTHRFLTFCAASPLQAAVATTLAWAADTGFFERQRDDYRARRDLLVDAARAAGLAAEAPEGGHFVVAAVPGLPATSLDAALRLAREAGVVALPLPTFFDDAAAADNLVRLAFCKGPAALAAGAERLAAYGTDGRAR